MQGIDCDGCVYTDLEDFFRRSLRNVKKVTPPLWICLSPLHAGVHTSTIFVSKVKWLFFVLVYVDTCHSWRVFSLHIPKWLTVISYVRFPAKCAPSFLWERMKTGLPKPLYLKKGGIGQPKYCTQLNQWTVSCVSFVSSSCNTKECNVLRGSLLKASMGVRFCQSEYLHFKISYFLQWSGS